MRRIGQFAVLLLVLGAVAAGVLVLTSRAGAVQPLERLPGGIIGDPAAEEVTDASAVITLRTAEPAFCQVNYGPTTAYGQMRRMSMSGPMTEHRILLPGLQPDTVYHFRLTAVDAQARVYQSADLTFKTRPATTAAPAGRNVALLSAGARVVGVSSTYGGGGMAGSAFGASNAIDGDPGTEWSSDGDGDDAWIEVELARPSRLVAIGFWTRTMGTSAQITSFEVIVDGKIRLRPFTLPDAGRMHRFPVDVTAKRLRFEILESSGGNTGAVEIAAWAAP